MSSKVFILIFIAAVFTRFWNLNWGNGYYFHPDENNMATALSQLSPNNFNPHFFAYGQFPLYLGYFSLKVLNLPLDFSYAIFILRFWSAVFSLLSLYIFYLIYPSVIFQLLLIFSPGLIQISHFGTTESLLILVFAFNLYLAKQILLKPNIKKYYLYSGIITGIGLASKISSLIFLAPIFLAILYSLKKYKNIFYPIFYSCLLLLVSCLLFIILSPYNLITYQDFILALNYETQVATGSLKVFYTQQFDQTLPYIFQFIHIFPYVSGLPMFFLALLALILQITKHRLQITKYSIIIFISCLIYFLYFGQLYVKWTRFMSPIFFIFPLLTSLFISRMNSKIKFILLIISIVPGIMFMNLYLNPDIRVEASTWVDKFIPKDSIVFSESGNVNNIPRANIFLDFYNTSYSEIASQINASDYIIVPSRRVFKNNYYPNYYQKLFSGELGFTEVKTFTPNYDLFLNAENAEETWTVFDRPTIRIFKKIKPFTLEQYQNLLMSNNEI